MTAPHTSVLQSAAMLRIWDFPKLKGQENYQPWAKSMKSALRYSRLWEIVEKGMGLYPSELPEETSHVERANDEHPEDRVVIDRAGPTEAQIKQYNTEHDHWMDMTRSLPKAGGSSWRVIISPPDLPSALPNTRSSYTLQWPIAITVSSRIVPICDLVLAN